MAMRVSRARWIRRFVIVLIALVIVMAVPADGVTRTTTTRKTTKKAATKVTTRATDKTTPFPKLKTPYAKLLESVAADLDAWWTVELPARYGVAYKPMKSYYGFTSVSSMPPGCGTAVRPRYEDVAGNAYYCPDGDFVAWDDEGLFPDMAQHFGAGALGVVLAHEMAHAVQTRAGVAMSSVYMELQADCVAGAWLKRVSSGGSSRVQLPASTIDDAVLAGLEFSDTVGLGAEADGAHGDGFDRVNAIHLGWQSGLTRCVTIPTDPPLVTATTYTSMEEQASNGNVPLSTAVSTAVQALDAFWGASVPGFRPLGSPFATDAAGIGAAQKSCSGSISLLQDRVVACAAGADGNPKVAYDEARLAQIYRGAGDFGVSTVLALAWSALAERRVGQQTPDQSIGAELTAICTMGAWSGALYRGTVSGALALSPGDLDEATAVLLLLTWRAEPFDRIDRFRDGFDLGLAACR